MELHWFRQYLQEEVRYFVLPVFFHTHGYGLLLSRVRQNLGTAMHTYAPYWI